MKFLTIIEGKTSQFTNGKENISIFYEKSQGKEGKIGNSDTMLVETTESRITIYKINL
jgi:hypothetical protein